MQTNLPLFLGGALLLLGLSPAAAQTAPPMAPCGTRFTDLPAEQRTFLDQVERQTQEYVRAQLAREAASAKQRGGAAARPAAGYTYDIPVVVHVVYSTASQASIAAQNTAVSDQAIAQQLAVLNEDFLRYNADASNTPSVHQAAAANTLIHFTLAGADPQGHCSTGIERVPTSSAPFVYGSYLPTGMKYAPSGANAWDPTRYLNIWVCELDAGPNATLQGFATLPGHRNRLSDDGVVIDYRYFGPTVNPTSQGRAATHEVGHYFNLHHIFGDREIIVRPGNNCADDRVSDTPPVEGTIYPDGDTNQTPFPNGIRQIAQLPCAARTSNCNGQFTYDMYTNYMDYTPGNCQNFFTAGQAYRMQALLQPGGARAGLVNSNRTQFYPTPTSTVRDPNTGLATASFCGLNKVEILATPLVPCASATSAVVSYTFTLEPVDANAEFADNHDPQSVITTDLTNPMATVNLFDGDYEKHVLVTANYANGDTSPPSIQILKQHTGPPANSPDAPYAFQEDDNSCYFGIYIPVTNGTDDVVLQAGGYRATLPVMPTDPGRPTPPPVQFLATIRAHATDTTVQVTVTPRNVCGAGKTTTYYVSIPAAPPGCRPEYTNRSAPVASTPASTPAVTLYPNPATQEVTLKSALAAGFSAGQIHTPMGLVVKTFRVTSESPTIRLDDLKPGLYIVELSGKARAKRYQISISTR
ncbi:zinc-dependent metalloprotease [Hymenobacter convexus]|uniref:zinc-dependent metalloprotease n=1 Tax=Hymenobacter sp. CA1UV-4 TaxID=3063782 RepID=UPI002712C40A|nr:zinc-dependent metalloprotease [Hymenobacter sp. CA1UV-4]MDO7852301.1 zinc-dependent metalloprotease [Hymenobacter sp. CA1UV-4]